MKHFKIVTMNENNMAKLVPIFDKYQKDCFLASHGM